MDAYGKRVLARLKTAGLPDLEEAALKDIVGALFDELVVEVQTNNKTWDDILAGPLKGAKDLALKALDKIDGKVSP